MQPRTRLPNFVTRASHLTIKILGFLFFATQVDGRAESNAERSEEPPEERGARLEGRADHRADREPGEKTGQDLVERR